MSAFGAHFALLCLIAFSAAAPLDYAYKAPGQKLDASKDGGAAAGNSGHSAAIPQPARPAVLVPSFQQTTGRVPALNNVQGTTPQLTIQTISTQAGSASSGNVVQPLSGAVPIREARILSGGGNFVSGAFSANGPQYEEHIQPQAGHVPVTYTETVQVTKTHILRVPSTSDVWVTSVKMVTVPVTQLSTQRSYRQEAPGTVTSFVRVTRTPIEVVTRTAEIYPTKTMVSVFTHFVTETSTVELWQPINHVSTSYEVMTVPVLHTQTLLQKLYTTVTATTTVDVTSRLNRFF